MAVKRIFVLAPTLSVFSNHSQTVSAEAHLQEARLIYCRPSNLRGIRFGLGDQLHTLDGYATRDDIEEVEGLLRLAQRAWVPETWQYNRHGEPRMSTAGCVPPPPLDDRAALEHWLTT